MLGMETIRKIRLELGKGTSIREAARKFNKSRATPRQQLITMSRSKYKLDLKNRARQALLEANASLAPARRRTLFSLYEELQGQGYGGSGGTLRPQA
jgi:transposase